MFELSFADELAKRVGSTVEVATDDTLLEGIIASVTREYLLLLVNDGYTTTKTFLINEAINYIRFRNTTAAV